MIFIGVSTAQHLLVNLTGVLDTSNVSIASHSTARADVLVGDVNLNRSVEGNDVSAVQGKTRQAVNSTTFRYDVNSNGSIEGNDVSVV